MEIVFVAGFAPIVSDPSTAVPFYRDTLGLPLEGVSGDYVAMEGFGGVKHFGVWPLADAAQACFGTTMWPDTHPVPHATVEFELADAVAVEAAVTELVGGGHTLVHDAQLMPWGQTIARLQSADGLLIGLCFTPWLHSADDGMP
jgi:catechol 2,3-dioxygenase-like lactoylglutathione lyase family enzyme